MYNHSEPVKVDLGMALIHLDLDEKVSVLEVGFTLKQLGSKFDQMLTNI